MLLFLMFWIFLYLEQEFEKSKERQKPGNNQPLPTTAGQGTLAEGAP
jgi:hypothetical protein